MAYRPVSTTAIDIKKEKGVPYIGIFQGLEVKEIQGQKRNIWHFFGEDSVPFQVWGFTTLDLALKNIKEGTKCRITYTGTQFLKTKFKPSGQDVHQCLVEVDDSYNPEPSDDIPAVDGPPLEDLTD